MSRRARKNKRSFFTVFRHQLQIVGGGTLSLRGIFLGPLVLIEAHQALTVDVQRAVAHNFGVPVVRTGFVNVLWKILGLN